VGEEREGRERGMRKRDGGGRGRKRIGKDLGLEDGWEGENEILGGRSR